jgi:hypothetical protein
MLHAVLFVVAFGVLVLGNSGSCTSNGMISPISSLSKGICVLVIGNDAFCGVLSLPVAVVVPTP